MLYSYLPNTSECQPAILVVCSQEAPFLIIDVLYDQGRRKGSGRSVKMALRTLISSTFFRGNITAGPLLSQPDHFHFASAGPDDCHLHGAYGHNVQFENIYLRSDTHGSIWSE